MLSATGFEFDDGAPTIAGSDVVVSADSAVTEETLGSRVDRYRLLELIGEGGFGEVYLAEQREPVRRKVALKIIKLGMDTRQVIARFDAERQALAMMDHPNIARVLDAGATQTGRPYFVMELVKGIPITEFCDQQRLSTQQRLSLFIDVCRAVQHAHQKGIIHRDLKPNNVLVTLNDGRPVPKVIDFGVAKATSTELTDLTLVTEFRQFIGTPEYMSPEQAEMCGLDIDVRADVYSLGVLLYELLTGTQPFNPKRWQLGGLQAIQKIICEEEPPKPSTRMSSLFAVSPDQAADRTTMISTGGTAQVLAARRHTDPSHLSRELRGDLDWIVMKCLEKDRTRRYVTANDLAEDVVRHLDNRPVLAGPPSTAYRTRKFARRHRAALTAVIGLAVVATGTFAIVVQQWRNAETARRSAEAGWTEAEHQRLRAESALSEAERASNFLVEMLGASDPEDRGRDVTVAQVLDHTAHEIPGQFPDSPLIEARLRYTIGTTYMALSDFIAAERQLLAARDIRVEQLGLNHDATLIAINALAQLYASQARYSESLQLHEQALDISTRIHGTDHERTIGLMNNLASLYTTQNKLAEAESLITAAIESARRALGEDHPYLLKALGTRANLLANQGRYLESIEALETLQEAQIRALAPDHPDVLASAMNIANAHMSLGMYEAAEAEYFDLLPQFERVHGEHAIDTLNLQVNMAMMYAHAGRMDRAGSLAEEVHNHLYREFGPVHSSTLEAASIASNALIASGEDDKAEQILIRLLEDHERLLGPAHARTLRSRRALVQFYRDRNRTAEVESTTRRHIELLTQAAHESDVDAYSLNLAAWELLTVEPIELQDPEAALEFARRACEIGNYRDAYKLDTLALAQRRNGRLRDAVATYLLALDSLQPDDPNVSQIEQHLAEAEAELQRYDGADSADSAQGRIEQF